MKKIILVAVLLLSSIFYVSATSFSESGYFDNTGLLLSDNSIQENLYSGKKEFVENIIEVNEDDILYKRWSSLYVGTTTKNKINDTYPMFIKDGDAIEFLNDGNVLFDVHLESFDTYKNLIINNGEAFNNEFERADTSSYVLAKLTNNLYINTQKMFINTETHNYSVSKNSFVYFMSDAIRVYSLSNDKFVYYEFSDIDENTIIIIDELEISYKDLMLKLGETSITNAFNSNGSSNEENNDSSTGNSTNTRPNNSGQSSIGNDVDDNNSEIPEDKLPQKGESAQKPSDAQKPDGSQIPEDQIKNPNNDKTPDVEPNWVMPEVTVSNTYDVSTYTILTGVNVKDPAGTIRRSSITFEVKLLEGPNAGQLFKRYAARVGYGDNIVAVTGLSATTKYSLTAYYYYTKEDGKLSDKVVVIDDYSFETKDTSELGTIFFKPISFNDATYYGDRINIPGLMFDFERSSFDAISGIDHITVDIKNDDGFNKTYKVSSSSVDYIKNGGSLSYTSPGDLDSGKTYHGSFTLFDKNGNILSVDPSLNKFTTSTCLKLPTMNVTFTKVGQEGFDISYTVNNPDNVALDNLHFDLYDGSGNLIQQFANIPLSLENNKGTYELRNLGLNKNFQFKVASKIEVNDGKEGDDLIRTLVTKKISTGTLNELGYLNLAVNNVSNKAHEILDLQEDDFSTATRALFEVGFDLNKTNDQLIEYVNKLSLTLSDSNDSHTYTFTKEEIEKLANGEKLYIDTDSFIENHLTSNTTYTLSWNAQYDPHLSESGVEGDVLDISVKTGLNKLVTPRKPVDITITNKQGIAGYISFITKVVDDDDIIVGDDLAIRIYKINNNQAKTRTFIGSFRIDKGVETKIVLSSDKDMSTDGVAYDIEPDTVYELRYYADEASTSAGIRNNYWVNSDKFYDIETKLGVEVKADLFDLHRSNYRYEVEGTSYTQLEYVQSTGTQMLNTGVIPSATTEVEFTWKSSGFTTTTRQGIIGSAWNSNAMLIEEYSSQYMYYGNGAYFGSRSTRNFDTIYYNTKYAEANGVRYTAGKDTLANVKANPLTVFKVTSYPAYGYMQYLKIWDNGKLIRDLVPVESENGEIGMLDLANKDASGNYVFYKSTTSTSLVAGPKIEKDTDKTYNRKTQLVAKIDLDIYEYNNYYPSNTIYVNAYRYIDGVKHKLNNSSNKDIHEIKYNEPVIDSSDSSGKKVIPEELSYYYTVDIDQNVNNYYEFEFYIILDDGTEVILDSVSFSTEEEIYTISSMAEFFAIGTKKNKYVVIKDLEYTASYLGRDDTKTYPGENNVIHWRSSYFGARVDFQGHSLTYSGTGPVIYRTTRDAQITNLVFKNTAVGYNTTGTPYGHGTFISYNYGTLSNIYMEYSEEYDFPYMHASYYTTSTATNATQYKYLSGGGLTNDNYGIIENFAFNLKTQYTVTSYSGLATLYNRSGGVVRNGYLYATYEKYDDRGNLVDIDYSADIVVMGSTNNYFGGVVGYNYTGATTENVFAIGNVEARGMSTDRIGIVVGGNTGIVRNIYAVGDTYANANGTDINNFKGKVTSYGPTVGYTTTSYTNQNVYAIADQVYTSANSTNFNTFISILSLKNPTWQHSVLNKNNRGAGFNVDSLLSVNCYPQVNYTSDCMPVQSFIPFDDYSSSDEIDIVYTYTYQMKYDDETNRFVGETPYIDQIFLDYIEDHLSEYTIGDEVWTNPDENGVVSNIQPVIILVSDKKPKPVESIIADGINIDVISYTADGKGVTTVYAIAKTPSTAVDRYKITDVNFKEVANDVTTEYHQHFTSARYLNCKWFKVIDDVDSWLNTMHPSDATVSKTITQNISIKADIDFEGRKLSEVYVKATYKGDVKGNGHKLYNFGFESCNSADFGGDTYGTGLFRHINGSTVSDLQIDGLYYEGGKYAGVLAGETTGTTLDNIYITNSYVLGGTNVGGIVGRTNQASTIVNCGLNGVKLASYQKADTDTYSVLGGVVGYVTSLTYISDTYVDNLYIENLYETSTTTAGGIAGYINGAGATGSSITNCYAKGVINAQSTGLGGIVGTILIDCDIDNVYADVDIITHGGNAGGIVGRSLSTTTPYITNAVSFGNIVSGNLLRGSNVRLEANSLTLTDSASTYDLAAVSSAEIDIRYIDDNLDLRQYNNNTIVNSNNIVKKFNSEIKDVISYNDVSSHLNIDYFDIDLNERIYLPHLIIEDYKADPNTSEGFVKKQEDTLISSNNVSGSEGSNSKIVLQSFSYQNDTLRATVVADSDIKVLAVYSDYTYVDEMIGLKKINESGDLEYVGNVEKSETSDQSFNLTYSPISEPDVIDGKKTYNFVYDNATVNTYKDLYRITAIKYEDGNGEIHYLKVNKTLDSIYLQFLTINNKNDWNNYFYNGAINENIKLNGNLDFSDDTIYYNGSHDANDGCTGFNIVANRVIGTKTTTNYLDYYENKNGTKEFPYVTISNVTMSSSYNKGKQWIHEGFTGLFKAINSELAYVSFDNFNLSRPGGIGVLGIVNGIAHDLTFTNNTIKGTSTRYLVGSIAISNAKISNVYVGNTDLTSGGYGTGGLVGYIYNNKSNIGISNVIVENLKITKNGNYIYSGGVAGAIASIGYSHIKGVATVGTLNAEKSFKFENCDVINIDINSYTHSGGLAGLSNNEVHYSNCNVIGSNIVSRNNYAGGLVGQANSNYSYTKDCYVYNSFIKGTSYVGGISGDLLSNTAATVEECTIVGTASYVGGLDGRAQTNWIDNPNQDYESNAQVNGWVINSKIYGNSYVGGLNGYMSSTSLDTAGFVENCEIYGNTYVGGAIGYNTNYWVGSPYIHNSIIAPVRANSYGVAVSSTPSYFGGLTGYGGRAAGLVENCVIGGKNVDYVGGLLGRIDYYESNYLSNDAVCKDSVVLGNNYVGGFYGIAVTKRDVSGNNYYLISQANYSNAYVVGNDYVAGFAGYVAGYKSSTTAPYVNMPIIEYSYFTGTLISNNNASAIFGKVNGNTSALRFMGLVSMPDLIKAKHVDAVVTDQNMIDNPNAYNFSHFEKEKANIKISLWAQTKIELLPGSDQTNLTSMKNLMETDKYSNHYSYDLSDVENDFKAGYKEDRKTFFLYSKDHSISNLPVLRNLPMGYTQLEYIQSTGTQMINTGIIPDATTKVEFSWLSSNYSASTRQGLVGSSWSANGMLIEEYSNRYMFYGKGEYVGSRSITDFDIVSYTPDANTFTLNGVLFNNTKDTLGNVKDAPLTVFKVGTGVSYGKMSYMKIWKNNQLVRDFVPCMNEKGEIGFYDMVSESFFKNTGTGLFTAGKPVMDFEKVDYTHGYIAGNIMNSLSGPGAVAETNNRWYYTSNIYNEGLMPFTSNGSGIVYYNNFSYTSNENPVTGISYSLKVRQGVPMPDSDNFEANSHKREGLYNNYQNYLSTGNKEELLDTTNLGVNKNEQVVGFDAYMSDVDVINIDISPDSIVSYTEIDYIEANGNQYIDTGYTLGYDSKIEAKYNLTKTTGSIFGSFQGNAPWTHLAYSGNFYLGSTSISGIMKTGEHVFSSEITSSKNYKVVIDGVERSGTYKNNIDNYSFKIFASGNTGNYKGYGKLYYLKMYDNGNKVRDFIPVISNTGETGLYDLVEKKFYKSKTATPFVVDENALTSTGTKYNQYKIRITGEDSGNEYYYGEIDRRTYSFVCDMSEGYVVEIIDISGNKVIKKTTVYPYNIARKVSTYNNNYYYISSDKMEVISIDDTKLGATTDSEIINRDTHYYINDSGNMVVNSDEDYGYEYFVNIYGNKVMDSSGNVYDLATRNMIGHSSVTNSNPLLTFEALGKTFYTYGTYTLASSNDNAISGNRWFKLGNDIHIINKNSTAKYNDYYVYGNIELYLRKSGVVKSIGSIDAEEFYKGFKQANKNIAHISTSFNNNDLDYVNNSRVLLVEYKDGSVRAWNSDSGNEIKNLAHSESFDPSSFYGPSLMSFLFDSFDDMFDFGASPLLSNRLSTFNLVNLMSNTGLSLNEVIELTDNVDDISKVISDDGELLVDITGIKDNDELINDKDNAEEDVISIKDVLKHEDYELLPMIEGVTDKATLENKTEETEFISADLSNKYAVVYNEELDDYDIYSYDELFNNITEPESENSKVVDKNTLKSLYSALGKDDPNNRNGVILYALVAVAIVALAGIVMILDLMKKKGL